MSDWETWKVEHKSRDRNKKTFMVVELWKLLLFIQVWEEDMVWGKKKAREWNGLSKQCYRVQDGHVLICMLSYQNRLVFQLKYLLCHSIIIIFIFDWQICPQQSFLKYKETLVYNAISKNTTKFRLILWLFIKFVNHPFWIWFIKLKYMQTSWYLSNKLRGSIFYNCSLYRVVHRYPKKM